MFSCWWKGFSQQLQLHISTNILVLCKLMMWKFSRCLSNISSSYFKLWFHKRLWSLWSLYFNQKLIWENFLVIIRMQFWAFMSVSQWFMLLILNMLCGESTKAFSQKQSSEMTYIKTRFTDIDVFRTLSTSKIKHLFPKSFLLRCLSGFAIRLWAKM